MIEGTQPRTVTRDGVDLAVVEAGDPTRPTIVFIHGYPDTKELWDGVLRLLEPRFHTVAYDVRGAGESSRPSGSAAYDLAELGDDLLAVAEAVAPGSAVHLVGHDWGGIQGWEFATQPRFRNVLASLTTLAGPSLDQVAMSGGNLLRRGRVLEAVARARRSWYVVALCTPGGPTVMWRLALGGGRWQRLYSGPERPPAAERATIVRDGLDGANLYRQNIPRRLVRPRREAVAHVPVQLIVPANDPFISPSYYERAERFAPRLVRRSIDASHWAPRSHPKEIAEWIGEFVEQVESG